MAVSGEIRMIIRMGLRSTAAVRARVLNQLHGKGKRKRLRIATQHSNESPREVDHG